MFFRLQKEVNTRATLHKLLYDHPFLQHHSTAPTDVAGFVADVLDNSSADDEVDTTKRRQPPPGMGGAAAAFMRNGVR